MYIISKNFSEICTKCFICLKLQARLLKTMRLRKINICCCSLAADNNKNNIIKFFFVVINFYCKQISASNISALHLLFFEYKLNIQQKFQTYYCAHNYNFINQSKKLSINLLELVVLRIESTKLIQNFYSHFFK